MSIQEFFDKSVTVFKHNWVQDADGWHTQKSEDESFVGHIQQISEEFAQSQGLSFTKTYNLWFGFNEDLEENDVITIEGDEYSVVGIKRNEDPVGNDSHKKALITLTNRNVGQS